MRVGLVTSMIILKPEHWFLYSPMPHFVGVAGSHSCFKEESGEPSCGRSEVGHRKYWLSLVKNTMLWFFSHQNYCHPPIFLLTNFPLQSIQTYWLQFASVSAPITSLLFSSWLCQESLHNTQSSCGKQRVLVFQTNSWHQCLRVACKC